MALFSKGVLSLGSIAVNLLPLASGVSAPGSAFKETREPMLTQTCPFVSTPLESLECLRAF